MDTHNDQHTRITKITIEDLTTFLTTNEFPNATTKLTHTNMIYYFSMTVARCFHLVLQVLEYAFL